MQRLYCSSLKLIFCMCSFLRVIKASSFQVQLAASCFQPLVFGRHRNWDTARFLLAPHPFEVRWSLAFRALLLLPYLSTVKSLATLLSTGQPLTGWQKRHRCRPQRPSHPHDRGSWHTRALFPWLHLQMGTNFAIGPWQTLVW